MCAYCCLAHETGYGGSCGRVWTVISLCAATNSSTRELLPLVASTTLFLRINSLKWSPQRLHGNMRARL